MKRRSPWLTFAACALAGASCLAQTAKAEVTLDDALTAARNEIKARGAHCAVDSIQAVRTGGQFSHYLVTTYPGLPAKDDPAIPVVLKVDATGKVSDSKMEEVRREIRVIRK